MPRLSEPPASGLPLLQAHNLAYSYGERQVLKNVSLSVYPGEVLALLGPNGTGKSTLLRLLLGLETPANGRVMLRGKPLSSLSRRRIAAQIAYVPQSHVCPFPYTVRQVVAMGKYHESGMFGRSNMDDDDIMEQHLRRLRIEHLADRPYTQISGGERQLALVCRALVQGANLLLLDEPASALDFGHQARLLTQLRQLADEGYSVVMTTHHPHHARMIAHRALLLKEGVVVGEGSPHTVLSASTVQSLYDLSAPELAAFSRGMVG